MVISMRESVVDRYVERATADMYRNNRKEISCPCRKCKLGSLFNPSSGIVQEHLLRRGFMEGYTQWMSDDEDDHEEVSGAAAAGNGEEGQEDNDDDEEATAHDDGDQYGAGEQHVEEDADRNTPLTSVVRDPHVQELLPNKSMTDDPRVASRRKSKLAQLEIDSKTPLYDAAGRGPEESRLRVALDVLRMRRAAGGGGTSSSSVSSESSGRRLARWRRGEEERGED